MDGLCALEEGGCTGRQGWLLSTGLELRNAEGVLPGFSDAWILLGSALIPPDC